MYDAYINYLGKFSSQPLTGEDKVLIKQNFKPIRLGKRKYILQDGDVCKKFAFIVKGAMRMYFVDDKGLEHIVRLGIEDWWMGDRESFINQTPSRFHIDALEQCDLLCMTLDNAKELEKKVPAFRQMMNKLDERNIMANERRLTAAISFTAEKRYIDFAHCYPELVSRFPQHIIASYLGINKDTLSRVKRRHNLK
ncbi:Crp/Fnr family transcriptional regulator [Olivibacter domesticus]|uniref:cAMP-binding domain of CRP or a regulatory subunit of cAMP-dependent protein kinases n=1 Tax=Olivibacter domesticus TaxID=407022 RepID=A0A1H7M9Z3_OLID1|nr:Crp/Fnr family transcriptional regulator [Olivibacter domesticus]SEL07984.1 cAMP-binding domain of CRP or a regulatory subunit of cAMP-dependent protein kinases [Olivibacter domesticus]